MRNFFQKTIMDERQKIIKREYLKMLPGEYTVSVMNVLAEFRNKTNPELYYIVGVDQE